MDYCLPARRMCIELSVRELLSFLNVADLDFARI